MAKLSFSNTPWGPLTIDCSDRVIVEMLGKGGAKGVIAGLKIAGAVGRQEKKITAKKKPGTRKRGSAQNDILEFNKAKKGPSHPKVITKATKYSSITVYKALKVLVAMKAITKIGRGEYSADPSAKVAKPTAKVSARGKKVAVKKKKTASKRAPSTKNAAKTEVHATPGVSKDEAKSVHS
ncbi:MAG: hypothetical protein HQL31_10915, partial [Planctomycetes bacterium]|nr:hypothetical protein [Planctomycetota bacterium]